jgi:four helix bundle protein
VAKINIAQKEARETRYWLKLLVETEYLKSNQVESLFVEIDELIKIIAKILITMRSKNL